MKLETPLISIILFSVAALFGAIGQLLYKSGANISGTTVASYIFNLRLIGGVFCYFLVMIMFVVAFKKGGDLSVLYPIYASTFIWSSVIAYFVYDTNITLEQVGGMVLLILGMYLMGKS